MHPVLIPLGDGICVGNPFSKGGFQIPIGLPTNTTSFNGLHVGKRSLSLNIGTGCFARGIWFRQGCTHCPLFPCHPDCMPGWGSSYNKGTQNYFFECVLSQKKKIKQCGVLSKVLTRLFSRSETWVARKWSACNRPCDFSNFITV